MAGKKRIGRPRTGVLPLRMARDQERHSQLRACSVCFFCRQAQTKDPQASAAAGMNPELTLLGAAQIFSPSPAQTCGLKRGWGLASRTEDQLPLRKLTVLVPLPLRTPTGCAGLTAARNHGSFRIPGHWLVPGPVKRPRDPMRQVTRSRFHAPQ